MGRTVSEQRWAENEVIFRQHNEQVEQNLKRLKRKAETEGYGSLIPDIDFPLYFYCECSDENCRERILLKPEEHRSLRKNNKQFIVKAGHEVPAIERVVRRAKRYVVAEKYETPPKAPGKLNPTNLRNA